MEKRKLLVLSMALFFVLFSVMSVYALGSGSSKPKESKLTKYPIVLVPGVFAFNDVFGSLDMFYGIEDSMEDYFDGADWVHYADINPWQNTEDRGEALADYVDFLCNAKGYAKVNLIAHSHGSTTSRVAMTLTDNVASLTTIGGPHFGTPVADFLAKDAPDWFASGAYAMLNLASDVVEFFSTSSDYISQSSSGDVINDFTWEQIEKFNAKYPSAGLPSGVTYGTGLYGKDAVYDQSYWGNGFGADRNGSEADAIRFYSMTGDLGTDYRASGSIDIAGDVVTLVTRTLGNLYSPLGDADGFIPVASSIFGEAVASYEWNHCDEVNHVMGLLGWRAADPKTVYEAQASRLKLAGL
jgi:triacylglycerol lipase